MVYYVMVVATTRQHGAQFTGGDYESEKKKITSITSVMLPMN